MRHFYSNYTALDSISKQQLVSYGVLHGLNPKLKNYTVANEFIKDN